MKKLLLLFILIPFIGLSQVQIGSDIDGELSGDRSGHSVSLSGNGNVVAIGSPMNGTSGSESGQVQIYENQSGTWIQIGSDINSEAADEELGLSVSLSDDGNVVAIGAHSGHVRVYENLSGIWTQIGFDIDGEPEFDQGVFTSVISSEGNAIAIGFNSADNSSFGPGHVRIYENQSGTWTQIGFRIVGEGETDLSGFSVSLSADGSVVAIGAILNNDNGFASGHVRVYENQLGNWIQIGSDIDGEAAFDSSGSSVSLSDNGNLVAIGAPLNNGNSGGTGQVRIYENQSGNWVQISSDIDGEGIGDQSGLSVSLSADGSTVAIGAPSNNDNGNGPTSGHVRVYDLSALLSTNEFVVSDISLYPNPTKTQFTIQLENNTELENVNIYNNLGQLVLSSKEPIIDASKLAAGLYVVEIETNKGKGSKNLIIE